MADTEKHILEASHHQFTTAYVDIDNARLDWFVKKYSLAQWWQMERSERKHYPFAKFYTLEPRNGIFSTENTAPIRGFFGFVVCYSLPEAHRL